MSKKINQTLSTLTLLRKKRQKIKEKIKVDRTYVEPQEFQSKKPKKINKFFSFLG